MRQYFVCDTGHTGQADCIVHKRRAHSALMWESFFARISFRQVLLIWTNPGTSYASSRLLSRRRFKWVQ